MLSALEAVKRDHLEEDMGGGQLERHGIHLSEVQSLHIAAQHPSTDPLTPLGLQSPDRRVSRFLMKWLGLPQSLTSRLLVCSKCVFILYFEYTLKA